MKEVPGRDTRYRIRDDGRWIETTDLTLEISECDEYALEESLKLQEEFGGDVALLTLGSDRVEKSIRKGLAMGAQRGIHVLDEQGTVSSPHAAAAVLAAALRDEAFDLILAGTQSDDFGYAQTGVILAEYLDLPHATIVMEIQADPENRRVKALREMESGWFQWVELPLPALLTVQAGIYQVRYPSLKGIMQAKKKEVRRVGLDDLQVDWNAIPAIQVLNLSFPETSSRVEMLEGDVETSVSLLVDKLKKEAKVL